jgi:two-component system, OmpR family, sensor histidine kinase ArlS
MPVRLRITLLFATIVLAILTLICGSIYYFSYSNRIWNISTRLTNRALTTGRLLSQSEIFDHELIRKIDSSTTVTMIDKTVQVYNYLDQRIYTYSDIPNDTLTVDSTILDEARIKGRVYFRKGKKDAVAYHFTSNDYRVVMVVAAIDNDGEAKLSQLAVILWLSLLGGILVAVVGGYIFSERLLRPIKKIADEVNEISAQSLARRIATSNSKDEWSYLSLTLNQLLNRLQESFEVQRRFISNASHELSTPLTSISSQLEVSLQRDREADQYRTVMHSIYQDVRHLSKVTQTLLEFAKAAGTPGGLEIDLVRIDEVLMRLPGDIAKLDHRYVVLLKFEELPPEEEKLLVLGNEGLLFTALKNIATNACKYSSNHTANIKLSVTSHEITIIVADEGRGIPEEEISRIFQPFYRVDGANEPVAGFGLGLSLTSRIIKLHKGNISVSSVVGKGSVFTVTLPPSHEKHAL